MSGFHVEQAVALLQRTTGEVMDPDAMRAALDTANPETYNPRLVGKLMAYAERERLGMATKSTTPGTGPAFR